VLAVCETNGPTEPPAKAGVPATPVSTMPLPLGCQPGHCSLSPGVPACPPGLPSLPEVLQGQERRLRRLRAGVRVLRCRRRGQRRGGEHGSKDERACERLHPAMVALEHYSYRVATTSRSTDFVALGSPGSSAYAGLETFPNPGVAEVELVSDELTAVCPITGQPDLYKVTIGYQPDALCLESKSLKLHLASFRNEGVFCEALAVRLRDEIATALELPPERVRISLEQKARGGITITSRA
jgi:7-cyano-7-deazaguanine reductase